MTHEPEPEGPDELRAGHLIGPVSDTPGNGRCSRCGRDVRISGASLDALAGRMVEAEDGWITVVCRDCAGELFASPLCRLGEHRSCFDFTCPCECHVREGE